MKTLYRSLVLLLAVTLLFSTNVLAKNENATKSLVALGDSIPYGYNLGENNDSPSKEAFPYLIGKEQDMRVRNLAIPGWQTGHMLNAVKTDQKYRQAIRHADYITLTIGNNDLLQVLAMASTLSGGDPVLFNTYLNQGIANSKLFQNLWEIVAEIRSLTDAPVIVYNVYNPFQVNDPLHYVARDILPAINGLFDFNIGQMSALYKNLHVADAYNAFNNPALYLIPRDIHPTVEGQKVLAEVGLGVLETIKNK